MSKHTLQRVYLVLAAAVALAIGLTLVIAPHALHGSNGIDLGTDANLLSEVRAPGAFLVVAGAVILAGALRSRLAGSATAVAAALYLSYGLGRAVGWALDGRPHESLVAAMVIEVVLGLVALAFLRPSAPHAHACPAR